MGATKRLLEQQESQRAAARKIAVEAGVLNECDVHSQYFFDGGKDIENAYKLGNSLYSANTEEFDAEFGTRLVMTDAIKSVVEEYCLVDYCTGCAKIEAE